MAPKVLIASTCRWFSVARIAIAFHREGCGVEAVCPGGHPILLTRALANHFSYNALAPLRSFRSAILLSKADLVVPCDDLAMHHLHRLHNLVIHADGDPASNTLRDVLQRSLGDPAGYSITESRDNFMAMVYQEGIHAPETKTVTSLQEMESWLARFGFPAVLKADGTSGGEGVKIVHTLPDARRAFRILHSPLATIVVAKRTILDRDRNCIPPWLAQRKRAVSIQSFQAGPDANMAIACWKGEILASISVEVLQTWKSKGPATIIRFLENNEMYQAAEKILRRLKFSGLCGLDFLLDKSTGAAYLIEMNARATQTSTLRLGSRQDLIASLCSAFTGKPVRETPNEIVGDTVALFPLAWQGDTTSPVFQSAHKDVPWEEPELARQGFTLSRKSSREQWIRLFSKIGLPTS